MFITISLNEVKDHSGKTLVIDPEVHIEVSVDDNYTISKLRVSKTVIEDTIRKELNNAIEYDIGGVKDVSEVKEGEVVYGE